MPAARIAGSCLPNAFHLFSRVHFFAAVTPIRNFGVFAS
jgi:hypothetical protein